jgi:hypothetical protein
MTLKQRTLLVLVIVLGVTGAFGAGTWVGGYAATHLPVQVADGYVGEDQASFEVGDTTYGFESSVNWTDNLGAFHDDGWPACLPKVSPVKGSASPSRPCGPVRSA